MRWRHYPFESMWREMEEMRSELDQLFSRNIPADRFLLPGGIGDRMIPAIRGEFRVDVREHEDEVIVVADLPGVEKEMITITLVNPRALEISCERDRESEDTREGYYVRERNFGTMRRIVTLPTDVMEEDSRASFKNGVLEVVLHKVKGAGKGRIAIE